MMQGYKYVTSHDALVAALAAILSRPHWFKAELQRDPVTAAKHVTKLLAVGLSASPEHVPLRIDSKPVLDTSNFFA